MPAPHIYVTSDVAPDLTLRAWRLERRPVGRQPSSLRRRLARRLTSVGLAVGIIDKLRHRKP